MRAEHVEAFLLWTVLCVLCLVSLLPVSEGPLRHRCILVCFAAELLLHVLSSLL